MTYRSIFLHLDDGDAWERTIDVGASVAKSFGAELAGCYLVPGGTVTPFTSALLPDVVVQGNLAESGYAQDQAEARLRAAAATHALSAASFAAPAGDAIEQAVLHARHTDLAIVRQPQAGTGDGGFTSELAHAVLLSSGRPVLFVPHSGSFPALGSTVLVAWKETREAARALADALPFLVRARKVAVVAVGEHDADDAEDVAGALASRGVARYLARHGVQAEVRREVARDIDAADLVLSRAADMDADLIVMGGYGRSRLAERVLGGMTRSMLQAMTVPVLMSH